MKNNFFPATMVLMTLALAGCSAVTLTNRNTTEPVMVGQIPHLDAARPAKAESKASRPIMGYDKNLNLLFLLVAFSIQSNLSEDLSALADSQYSQTMEKTNCTYWVNDFHYKTYGMSFLVLTRHHNELQAKTAGKVKCAR